jgi:3-keto-5-aminohexanoate cleavage enzyme
MEKLIVTAALTGGLHGKEANEALPEQPDEIIEDALLCGEAGAAIVHLHARDEEGRGVGDPELFARINEGIRERSDLVIQNTTGGTGIPVEKRLLALDAKPEMASLNMGTVVFFIPGDDSLSEIPFVNLRSEIELFARAMLERGIKPELEVYNPSMFGEVENLMSKGLITEPCYVNMVMNVGGMGGYPGTASNLVHMVEHLPPGAIFNVSGVGKAQLRLNMMSMAMGGHVRVGLEDSVYYRRGELAEGNAQLVARAVRLAKELGRDVATPDEARAILGLR